MVEAQLVEEKRAGRATDKASGETKEKKQNAKSGSEIKKNRGKRGGKTGRRR